MSPREPPRNSDILHSLPINQPRIPERETLYTTPVSQAPTTARRGRLSGSAWERRRGCPQMESQPTCGLAGFHGQTQDPEQVGPRGTQPRKCPWKEPHGQQLRSFRYQHVSLQVFVLFFFFFSWLPCGSRSTRPVHPNLIFVWRRPRRIDHLPRKGVQLVFCPLGHQMQLDRRPVFARTRFYFLFFWWGLLQKESLLWGGLVMDQSPSKDVWDQKVFGPQKAEGSRFGQMDAARVSRPALLPFPFRVLLLK